MRNASLIAFTALALFISSCGKDAAITNPATQPAISDIASIAGAPDRSTLVGRSVEINDGLVQAVVGNYVFWAGTRHAQVPVVRIDKELAPVKQHVKPGERVKMTGRVRLVESVPANDPMWDLMPDERRKDIKSARVYIAAESVEILKP